MMGALLDRTGMVPMLRNAVINCFNKQLNASCDYRHHRR
jgi:hypothetical protein